jgi:DNA-binding transcriptional MerR regulator
MSESMLKTANTEQALTAADCARRTGLTVKALRVYEREGLLSPKRTLKGWRIYDASDLTRLGEVIALRALGLKLSDIASLLKGKHGGINRMLELQQEELLQRRGRIDAGLATLAVLRRGAAMGETLTITDIASAIKESQMTAITPEAIAWKRYEQMRPRVANTANADEMQMCCGHYQFEPGMLFHVFMDGTKLMAQIHGQPALQLFPEGERAYFYTDVPAQIIFDQTSADKTEALMLHQNGHELRAHRISALEAEKAKTDLKARLSSGKPHPSSKRYIEMLLDGQREGKPPLDLMNVELAAVVIAQSEGITRDLIELGKTTALNFLTVTPEGFDAYRATFENGELDVTIFIDDKNGKINGATLEPPKADSFWKTLRERVG